MNIQKKVNQIMTRHMGSLGAEKIEIDGVAVMAVPAEVDTDRSLMGGSRQKRDIDFQFPTKTGLRIRKGMAVKAQGKDWKIDNFRRGRAMTTITVIEPNRVEE